MVEDMSALVDYVTVPLPRKPRLAPWVTLVDLGDNRMQLRGAEFSFTLKHPVFIETFQSLHTLLDGQRTVEEIVSSCDPKYLPTTIEFLLKMLRANGALQEGVLSPPAPLTPETLANHENLIQFLSHFVLDPVSTLAQLHTARVAVFGSDLINKRIRQSLTGMGFGTLKEINGLSTKSTYDRSQFHKEVIEQLKEVDFLIACQDSRDFRFFQNLNAACLETQTRWMHVALSGTKGIMGPSIIPYQSACYICYDKRLASNAPELQSYFGFRKETSATTSSKSEGFLNSLGSTLAEQVTLEMARIITGFSPPQTIGRLYEFEATTPVAEGHDILRLPRCPACNLSEPKREPWDMITSNP